MNRVRPGTLVFGGAVLLVLTVSVALDVRRGSEVLANDAPRFSGSTVVAGLPSLLPDARLPAPVRVAIIRDEAAASFYDSPVLDSIVADWRRELAAIGADARVVSSSALAETRAAQVLVVPSSPCLTLATRTELEAAQARGQGLIVTGLTGLYDAGCRSLGFGLLVELTRASRMEVLDERAMVYVTLSAGSPLAAGLPPGARLELDPAGQVAARRMGRDAYYSDYSLHPRPAFDSPLLDGAVLRATRDRARVVYWGFELRHVVPGPWNQAVLQLLLRNSVAWAGQLPQAWIEPWPEGRRAAAVFAQDVEAEFGNARHALDSLRAAGVPGTYFLTSRLARQHKQLSRALARAGEVGTHSEIHTRLGGAPGPVQHARLRGTQRELHRLLGSTVSGLRPPEEQFDTMTMAAWLAAGGRYLLGANDARAAAPELLRIGHDTLVLIGRIGGDDFAMAGPGGVRTAETMSRLFLNELAQMRALGGLFLLSYHSQLLSRPDLVSVLATVARTTAADSGVWLATAGQVAEWWRARAALQVETKTQGPNVVSVLVHNRGEHAVAAAVARVALPQSRRVASASTPLLPTEAGMARLQLPELPAGAQLTFALRLEPLADAETARTPATSRRSVPPQRKAPWWQFWKRR